MTKKLVARIVVFAFACLWVLGLIYAALVYAPIVADDLQWSGIGSFWITYVGIWLLVTVIVIGAFVAYKAFRFVGKWELRKKDDTENK